MIMVNIAAQRLHSQQIEQPRLQHPGEMVAWLGAVQGQDYAGAKWSLGLRLPDSTDAAIEQAIADKTIVRTWVMRGTLHLVTAADIRWLVALVGPRLIRQTASRYRQLELDEATMARSNAVLVKALAGGKQLDRKELFAILEQNTISTEGQRGVHMLRRASLDGLIYQGVVRRNNPTFMLLDELQPGPKPLERDEALSELARRYFTSRGPATLQDFAGWSGLTVGDARAGLEAVKSQLVQDTRTDEQYWRSSSTPSEPANSPTVHLLPGFDEYLLGYKDRSAVLDPQQAHKVSPGKNGVFYPTIVIDGRIAGLWKRSFKKGAVIISPDPFYNALTAAEEHAFMAAAQRYAEYLEMPVVLP
jgi:hypothetical protein